MAPKLKDISLRREFSAKEATVEDFTLELQEAMHFDPTGIEGMKTLPEPVDYCSDPNEVRRVRSIVNGFLDEDECRGHGAAAARWYPLFARLTRSSPTCLFQRCLCA